MSEAFSPPSVPGDDAAAGLPPARPERASHEVLTATLHGADVCVAILRGADMRYTFVNTAYQSLAPGVPMVGRPFVEVFPDAAAAGALACLQGVLATGEPWEMERFFAPIPTDPGALWEGRAVRIVTADGEPAVVAFARNVADRVRFEADLRESRERLQAALAGSGAGTFRWNIQTNALDWDDSLDRLFGLSPGATVRSLDKFIERVHPEDRAAVVERCRRCAAEGADFDMEFRVVWPDGTTRHLSDKGKTFRDDEGRPAYMTGMCLDITERRRAGEARRASEALSRLVSDRYQALIAATGDIVWTNSCQGEMRGPQPAWCAYTGQSEAEVQGYGWANAVHPDDAQPTIDAWRHALAAGATFVFEHRVRRHDGVYRWFAIRAVPVRGNDGEVREWVGLHRDIDHEKRSELRLREAFAEGERARADAERANRAKDEFLAMLGHELRNPLSPMTTAVQVLKLRGVDAREVSVIERQTTHLTRLVDDLLDVSRITGGKVALRRERVEVSDLVAAAIETASPLIETGQHTLRVDVPKGGLAVDVDRVRLAQVLANLLTNAAKYTPPGGHIALTASRDGASIVITVKDDGAGISADLLPHVFDLFVQARQTLARSQGGLGLGLAIVKSLVALHGGSVAAHSDGVGRGSTFTVRLPEAAAAPIDAPSVSPAAAPDAKGRRVLIVDDNVDAAEMLKDALDMFGHATAVAHDGPNALVAADAFRPEIVLLDIGLPIMDGYEVAQRLRAGVDAPYMVALTGYGLASDRVRTREAGFEEHLTKPIDLDKLRTLLDAAPRRSA